MKALIFNSGTGSRMGTLTANKPKCLLPLPGGETILSRQLRLLSRHGIREAVITTGAYTGLIRQQAKCDRMEITLVENPRYAHTNYIYSMFLAEPTIAGNDLLMLHGDLVFEEQVLTRLLAASGNRCCVDLSASLPEKDFKGRLRDGCLQEVSVHMFGQDCFALQPLYKLDAAAVHAWCREVSAWIRRGQVQVYAEEALNRIPEQLHIQPLACDGLLLSEVDTPEDYQAVWEVLNPCRN